MFSDEPTGTGSRNEIQYAIFCEDVGKLLSLHFIIRKMVLNKTVHRIKRVNEDQALDVQSINIKVSIIIPITHHFLITYNTTTPGAYTT